MTPEDLAIRKPVWVAMSDLFLDTDVRIWYAHIARVLAESPFSHDELTRIFEREVAPIAGPNLLAVAGEWAGFDEEWLVPRIVARLGRTSRKPFIKSPALGDWEAVAVLVARLRKLDHAERGRRLALWGELSTLFLDRDAVGLKTAAAGWTPDELDQVWREEVWPSYGRSVELYRKYNTGYPNEAEVMEAFARARNAVS